MEPKFFIWKDGESGPFTMADIEKMLAAGTINGDSLVKPVGDSRYKPLREAFVVEAQIVTVADEFPDNTFQLDSKNTGSERKRLTYSPGLVGAAVAIFLLGGAAGWVSKRVKPNWVVIPLGISALTQGHRASTNDVIAGPIHLEKIAGSQKILGTVQNLSSNKITWLVVRFSLYDKDDVKIGEADERLESLDPGKSWKYQAYVFHGGVERAVLENLEFE